MRAYAPRFDGDVELWGLTGLLHDLDYERYPNLEDGHPRYAMRELEERGYPPELIRAVASHADFWGFPARLRWSGRCTRSMSSPGSCSPWPTFAPKD